MWVLKKQSQNQNQCNLTNIHSQNIYAKFRKIYRVEKNYSRACWRSIELQIKRVGIFNPLNIDFLLQNLGPQNQFYWLIKIKIQGSNSTIKLFFFMIGSSNQFLRILLSLWRNGYVQYSLFYAPHTCIHRYLHTQILAYIHIIIHTYIIQT